MSTIFWDDRSPSDAGASRLPILVWSLAPKRKEFVRFLGPWRGVWLHWVEKATHPCQGSGCVLCAAGHGSRWMGYAPALLWRLDPVEPRKSTWVAIVCPVTESMAEQLRGRELAGLVVELHRQGRSTQSPIGCVVIDRPCKDALPPPFDVTPILLRMWRLRCPPFPVVRGRSPEAFAEILPFFPRPPAELPGKEAEQHG